MVRRRGTGRKERTRIVRVSYVHIQKFKRFTDLRIGEIPESAQLVVLVGPNGCGKSSIFDAILKWHREQTGLSHSGDTEYYDKTEVPGTVDIGLHSGSNPSRDSLYIRTAYRNDADFSSSRISAQPSPVENPGFHRLIEDDKTVSGNYQRLLLDSMSTLYSEESKNKTGGQIVDELVGDIQTSMVNIFGDLTLNAITGPLGSERGSGAFYFRKGTVDSYNYKNLSGGEKAAFDLILDIHIKKAYFENAIYCIDEIESHLHTKVQGALLKELRRIVPDASQLWVTTHSLGVLRAAQEMEATSPGSVCLINFDGADPDVSGEIASTRIDRVAWEKMLSITLDDLSNQVAPKFIVVCEGSSVGNRRKDFDADVYDRILRTQEPQVVFVSGGNSMQIAGTGSSLRDVLDRVLPHTKVVALVDRDDKSYEEVAQYDGITLSKRNIESYLLADEVIEALAQKEGKPELREQALEIKAAAMQNSTARGNPSDDLKSAAGEIYNKLRLLLDIHHPGGDKDAFMKDTLSPLIVPGMETYQELKADIVDKVTGV